MFQQELILLQPVGINLLFLIQADFSQESIRHMPVQELLAP